MNNNLTDRYIYAVTRYLPLKMQADIEKELEGLISDMLEEKCGNRQPTENDIRNVLTELGTPEELALKYSGDEGKCLIGGTHYLMYKRILRIVLPIAAAGITFSSILASYLDWEAASNLYEFPIKMLGQTIGNVMGGMIQAFAIITIIFAIMYHKNAPFKNGDIISGLPPIPKKDEQIKPFKPIIDIMLSVFVTVLFLGFPIIAGAWLEGVGWIPVFETPVIRSFWFPIVLWAIFVIAKNSVRLMEGAYTIRLAAITAVSNILIAISAWTVFTNDKIMNPEFVNRVDDFLIGDGGKTVPVLFANFNLFFLGIVIFALFVETLTVVFKAFKLGSKG